MSQLTSALLVAAGALLGGAASAALTVKLMATDAGAAHSAAGGAASGKAASAKNHGEDDATLEALRGRLGSLERRLSLLTFAQEHSSPQRQEPSGAEAAPAGSASPPGGRTSKTVDDPVFEAAVRDVLDQVEDERQAERSAQRSESRAAQTARWLDGLGKQLELRPDQQEKIKVIVEERFNAVRALRDNAGQDRPVLRSEWRARMKELSDKAEQQLGQVLDPAQKKKYDALDEVDKLNSRGPGRGGGGRGR